MSKFLILLTGSLATVTMVLLPHYSFSQQADTSTEDCTIHLPFDGNANTAVKPLEVVIEGQPSFVSGLQDQAIRFEGGKHGTNLRVPIESVELGCLHDFSVQFWVRTTMHSESRGVVLSTKDLADNSLDSQKLRGWAFSISNGTWAWNAGSGNRRISYERTNGEFLRINDGRWHQLAMTHDSSKGLIRLYFDGRNLVTYNVKDSSSFEFGNSNPLTVGWNGNYKAGTELELPAFVNGAKQLQEMVDEFNRIGLPPVEPGEFQMLVSRPSRLVATKISELEKDVERNQAAIENAKAFDLKKVDAISKRLMGNPYTVHQSSYYNEVALLFKLYRLEDGKILIDQRAAERLARREVLHRPSFDMDELKLWNRLISQEEVLASYSRFFQPKGVGLSKNRNSLIAGSWNIYHGGLHNSNERDGYDSRQVIIDLLKREDVEVLMMQETYSSGDYIAAELGYYFATTIDWDNMHQGANISVLSRYPIKDVYVPPESTFMSVGARISLSQSQDINVISSWFGMRNFDNVFDFHRSRFDESDRIPTLLAGDFNAVPHTDSGDSPASRKLLDYGFVDAFRGLYPDVDKHPGYTHRSNRRIDQLYYKGNGLKNISTDVYSDWPLKFPSDHYLLKSVFELNYSTMK